MNITYRIIVSKKISITATTIRFSVNTLEDALRIVQKLVGHTTDGIRLYAEPENKKSSGYEQKGYVLVQLMVGKYPIVNKIAWVQNEGNFFIILPSNIHKRG